MFTPKGKFSSYEIMTGDTKTTGKFLLGRCRLYRRPRNARYGRLPPYTTFNLGTLESRECCKCPGTPAGSVTSGSMMSMLTSKRLSRRAANY